MVLLLVLKVVIVLLLVVGMVELLVIVIVWLWPLLCHRRRSIWSWSLMCHGRRSSWLWPLLCHRWRSRWLWPLLCHRRGRSWLALRYAAVRPNQHWLSFWPKIKQIHFFNCVLMKMVPHKWTFSAWQCYYPSFFFPLTKEERKIKSKIFIEKFILFVSSRFARR